MNYQKSGAFRIAGLTLAAIAVTAQPLAGDPAHAAPRHCLVEREDAVTLNKRTFKVGEVSRYKLDVKATIDGKEAATVSLRFKVTTRAAKPSGEFTLVNQVEAATSLSDGKEQDISAFMPTVTVMRDKSGKLSNKTEGGNPQAAEQIAGLLQAMAALNEAYLPKDAVRVGDKWKVTINTPGAGGSGATKAEGEATFAETETFLGTKSVKLRVTTDIVTEGSDDKTHSVSTLNIDPASGKLLKVSARADGTSMGMKIVRELELTALAADAATDSAKP